jgi:hypothetical protein
VSDPVPTALDLVHRYGGKEIADVAVPSELTPLTGAQMEAAAAGEDMSGWDDDARESAEQALARIAAAIGRAGTELAFYLRFRPVDAATPPWLGDDVQELARYHLYDRAGREDSTVRLRYQDVIKRFAALLKEDIAQGRNEDDSGTGAGTVQVQSQPRMFSRTTLRDL